jgi:hypothetical protein
MVISNIVNKEKCKANFYPEERPVELEKLKAILSDGKLLDKRIS